MSKFDVDVGGATYEVEAPDERTAWKWANATHNKIIASKPGGKFPVDITPAMPSGAELLAANPVTRGVMGAASPFLGLMQLGARNPVSKALGQDKWIDDKIQTLETMKKAGGHEGFDWAGLAGAVASPTAALMKLPLAATRAGRIGQGAGIGAAVGASTPVTEGEDFATAKAKQIAIGAAIGPIIPAAIGGVAKGAEVVRNVVDPWLPGGIDRLIARTANKAAGGKRQEVIDALSQNREIVPGSRAAAGEIAAPAGSAEFSALQRVVEPLKPTAYRDAAQAQDAARVTALRTVGQDKGALEAAEATRSANAATNYAAAYQQVIQADPKLAMIAKNPYFKEALPEALRLAEANGISPKTDLTQFLHYVKLSLDDAVGRTGEKALDNTVRNATQTVRARLIDWMGKKNPEYDAARAAFAAESKPINQMQVGQYLENKLVPALNDSGATANQRGALYSQAVRDAPVTLKRSTGFNRYDDIADVLTPPQTQTVTAIGQDLGRKAQYEDLATRGATAARDLIGDAAPKVPAAGMFNPKYSVARAIMNRLSGKISGKALEALAVKMQDPQEIGRIMSQMSAPERRAIMEEAFQQGGRAATIGASTGIARQY